MAENGSLVDTRIGAEVAASVDWGPFGVLSRLSRLSLEVSAKYPGRDVLIQPRVTRLGIEVSADSPTNPSDPRLTRLALEIAAQAPPSDMLVSRIGVEVATEAEKPDVEITRLGIEISGDRPGVILETDEPVVLPFYVHNWAETLEMETSFQTDVSQDPEEGSRERRSRLSKPLRVITPSWTVSAATGAFELIWDLMRLGNDKLLIPLYQDASRVSQASSGTFLWCSTLRRRFFAGSRVLIYRRDLRTRAVTGLHSRVVASVSDQGLTLTGALDGSPEPSSWFVVPAMLCEVSLEEELEFATDSVGVAGISFYEAAGSSSLRMLQDGEGGFEEFQGISICPQEINWLYGAKLGSYRQGEAFDLGKSPAVSLQGRRPELWQEGTVTCGTRESAWHMLTFLESRRGRSRPFWQPLALSLCSVDFSIISPTEIEVPGTRPSILNLQDFLSAICLKTRVGGRILSRVASVSQGLSSWTLTLTDALPDGLTASDISKISPCILACLKSDSFTEKWYTDGVAEFSFAVTELPSEISLEDPVEVQPLSHAEGLSRLSMLFYGPFSDYDEGD